MVFTLKKAADNLVAKFQEASAAYAVAKAVLGSSDISLSVDVEDKQIISRNVDEEGSSDYEIHEIPVLGKTYTVKLFRNTVDKLTGLHNRRQFYKDIYKLLNASNQSVMVVLCDIDDFKLINGTYGWPVGDVVLKDVSKSLKTGIRSNDLLGRWGGEEFMLAFSDVSEEDMVSKLEHLKKRVSDDLPFRSPRIDDLETVDDFNVTVCMGSALYKKTDQDKRTPKEIFEDLYQQAAVMLANSKSKYGKNTLTTSSGYVTSDHKRVVSPGENRRRK